MPRSPYERLSDGNGQLGWYHGSYRVALAPAGWGLFSCPLLRFCCNASTCCSYLGAQSRAVLACSCLVKVVEGAPPGRQPATRSSRAKKEGTSHATPCRGGGWRDTGAIPCRQLSAHLQV